ncbi:hypothetical protein ACH4GE_24510 [Streptomyces tendae]|uniref:hypothetical protein n=1 Tax=Streptomyces tendae TaxID=1932 RepID=UPI0037B31553
MTDLNDHEPKQFYFDAETEHCPHKPIPERHTDAWDEWMTLGHQPYDYGILCLSAPCGTGCPACSAEQGDMVPWSRCETRSHTRPLRSRTDAPQHRPVTAEVADLECLERECEEFFTDDGDEIPGKDTCSHVREMEICEACSDAPVGDGDPHPPVVAWADCPQRPAASV